MIGFIELAVILIFAAILVGVGITIKNYNEGNWKGPKGPPLPPTGSSPA